MSPQHRESILSQSTSPIIEHWGYIKWRTIEFTSKQWDIEWDTEIKRKTKSVSCAKKVVYPGERREQML